MNLISIISISRPRFWLYLGGTYLVGLSLGFQNFHDVINPLYWAFFIFFSIPANLYLYGINDLFDKDTDKHNSKKGTQEHHLKKEEDTSLKIWLGVTLVMFVGLILIQDNWKVSLLLALFVFLMTIYSAPPLRLKSRIILDFSSNVFYLIPGIIGYIQTSQSLPHWFILWGLACWTFAMHLYSAIPDILADKEAGIRTTAVWLGVRQSLILCGVFWSVFSLTTLSLAHWFPWSLFSLFYPLIILLLLTQKEPPILKFYWLFPFINAIFGFGVYILAFTKLIYG